MVTVVFSTWSDVANGWPPLAEFILSVVPDLGEIVKVEGVLYRVVSRNWDYSPEGVYCYVNVLEPSRGG